MPENRPISTERVRTHSLGSMCAVCKTVLVPDNCSCGNAHGYTYQESNEWAARTWPDHPCFIPPERGRRCEWDC